MVFVDHRTALNYSAIIGFSRPWSSSWGSSPPNGRGQVIATGPLRAITGAPYPRAMTALVAATLAAFIDPIFRFSDYRDLLHLFRSPAPEVLGCPHAGLPAGDRSLLSHPSPPQSARTAALLLSVFVIVVQFSFRLTLSRFMTPTTSFSP